MIVSTKHLVALKPRKRELPKQFSFASERVDYLARFEADFFFVAVLFAVF